MGNHNSNPVNFSQIGMSEQEVIICSPNILGHLFTYIYKRVLVGGNQKNYNKLSFIIHNVRLPAELLRLRLSQKRQSIVIFKYISTRKVEKSR